MQSLELHESLDRLQIPQSQSSAHSPQSPVSRRKAPGDFCELLTSGEDSVSGVRTLSKVVHMPQDRDILFIVWRRRQEYGRSCYSPANEKHTFEAVREWKRTLVQCQAWYFSILLKERNFSKEELEDKLEPFLSQDGGRHLLAPAMRKGGKRVMAGDSESGLGPHPNPASSLLYALDCPELASLSVSEQAAIFVEYTAGVDSDELEVYARASGSIYVDEYIDLVKRFFLRRMSAYPRSPFVQDDRPALPDIKWPIATASREKLRKDCGPDDTSSQEEWIADILTKRAQFKHALSLLDTPKERAYLLTFYSRTQLCGILIAFFSCSKEPVGDRMLNATLNKAGLARVASELLTIDASVHIHRLFLRTYLTVEELALYEEARAASGELISQHRERFEVYRDNERHTTRVFWNKKAHDAARRQFSTDLLPLEKVNKVNELTWLFEEIFRQQDGQCLYCCAPLRISKGKAWNKASPDRRVSAKKGGEYSKSNVDILCVGCQFCKWWYKPSEFRVLLLAIANARWTVKDRLLCSSKPDLPGSISKMDVEILAGPWCKKVLGGMRERKDCDLILNDLMSLLQDRWMGDGLLVDEAGVVAPLETFSIDRIDSRIGYQKGNVRLLLWGLNRLKGDDKDDLVVIKYLQHLRSSRDKIQSEVSGLEDCARLPFQ